MLFLLRALRRNMGSSGGKEDPSPTPSPYSASLTSFPPVPSDPTQQAIEAIISQHFRDKDTFLGNATATHPAIKGKFKDMDFPPDASSLVRCWASADIECQVEWAKYEWKRLSEVFAGKTLAVFDDIQPGDIQQGGLRDSYFLAALSALAEKPERIQCLFITKEVQENCCYRISLFNLGVWSEYTIDDFVPVSLNPNGSYDLAFSGPKELRGVTELWTILLEKAWAKKYQSYYDIQTGHSSEVLTDLTGAPCEILYTSSEVIWEKLTAADEAGFVMMSATSPDGHYQGQLAGLLPNHCYAVLSAKTVDSVQLLKLRNPWGHYEWRGDWSDTSSLWTPEALSEMEMEGHTDDGVFCMALPDFQRYFESLTLCYVHDQFWSFNLPMDQTKEEEYSVVQLEVKQSTLLYFLVCQIDERRFGGEGGYQYAPVRLILSKQEGDSLNYIDGKASLYGRDAWMKAELDPGTYLWYIEMTWRSDLTALFGVSVYCANPITLKDVTSDYPNYLKQCYSDQFAASRTPNTRFNIGLAEFSSFKLAGKKANGDQEEGIYVDVFTNHSEEAVSMVIRHQPWSNLRLCKPYQNNVMGNFELEMPAKCTKIVIKKTVNMLATHAFKVMIKQRTADRD